jgi:hypothetical protein
MTCLLPPKVRGLAKVRGAECRQFWSHGCDGGEGEHFSISALRSGNDGSEWSEGEQHPSGRPHSVSAQGMPAQGIPRCTPYARGYMPYARATRGSLFFLALVATDSTLLLSLQKFVGWPDRPPGRDQPNMAVFSEIKRVTIPLYCFCYCFQCLANVNTKFLDSVDQPHLTYCE